MPRSLLIVFCLILFTISGFTQAQTTNACATVKLSWVAGSSNHTLEHDGLTRRYDRYIPASYDATQPVPLILSLHGLASNPGQQAIYSEWNTLAEEHGFIVVYPQGTGLPLRWNSSLRLFESENNADDVAFLDTLMDTLQTEWCIDPQRIYINGLSNGGGMSHRAACELADTIAAMGGVAGAYDRRPCTPARPVPVIAFHGTADRIVPYGGRGDAETGLPPVTQWAADWATRNDCADLPEALPTIGDASAVRYGDCAGDAEVILYTLNGGGHTWPGGGEISSFITGVTNRDIHASALMLDFFLAHPLGE